MVPEDDNPKVRVLNEIAVKLELDDAAHIRIVPSTSKNAAGVGFLNGSS